MHDRSGANTDISAPNMTGRGGNRDGNLGLDVLPKEEGDSFRNGSTPSGDRPLTYALLIYMKRTDAKQKTLRRCSDERTSNVTRCERERDLKRIRD